MGNIKAQIVLIQLLVVMDMVLVQFGDAGL